MFFGIFILTRILFIACMVFIVGYVFGSFSKSQVLTTLTKVAAILAIVLFIAGNAFMMRGGRPYWNKGRYEHCDRFPADSLPKTGSLPEAGR